MPFHVPTKLADGFGLKALPYSESAPEIHPFGGSSVSLSETRPIYFSNHPYILLPPLLSGVVYHNEVYLSNRPCPDRRHYEPTSPLPGEPVLGKTGFWYLVGCPYKYVTRLYLTKGSKREGMDCRNVTRSDKTPSPVEDPNSFMLPRFDG